MGCKTSAIRPGGSSGADTHEDHKHFLSSSPSPSKLKAARNSSQTTAGPTSEATQHGDSGVHEAGTPPPHRQQQQRQSSRSSMPTSPRRSSLDTTTAEQQQQNSRANTHDEDPFAPPPPHPPEVAVKSDSTLTLQAVTTSSDEDDDGGARARRHENHFDPIPMPENMQREGLAADHGKGRTPPRLPSADSRTVSRDATATFRTSISEHDKTDSAQAAKEYQQRMEAKRNAEEVHTKRRRLEEFDPVRPVDSFNVTHRGLLGRCWDRRAPEFIPVSFVHAIAKVIGVEESHPASTTSISHVSNNDEFPPGSPVQHLSRLSRQSGTRGNTPLSAGVSSSNWTGVGGRRVPRRSHWFSVGGVSTDGFATTTTTSSPTTMEPFYVSGTISSPVLTRSSAVGSAASALAFPSAATAVVVGGGVGMGSASIHTILNPPSTSAAAADNAKASSKRSTAAAGEVDESPDDPLSSLSTKTLTPAQVMALPWEVREKYFNLLITHNPRFMGIKDNFAFKLGSGVSNDRSVKFLRKRNLEPAPGVTAVRWNRVEFFHPSLHTLARAVATTQGMSIELQQIEQASTTAADCSEGICNLSGLYGSSPLNSHVQGSAAPAGMTDAAASPNLLQRSFSQFVMGHAENRSFSRVGGGGGNGGGGRIQNTSFLSPNDGDTASRHETGDVLLADKHNNAGTMSGGGKEKTDEHHSLRSGRSFLMGFHNHRAKDAEGGTGGSSTAASMRFPEESVLALALGMPYSRLGMLSGVPAAVRNAALNSTGRLNGNLLYPVAIGLGSRKASRDTMYSNITNTGGPGSSVAYPPSRGSGYAALRPTTDSALVSLSISSFSVSINPFEWRERHYIRYPVDIDGSRRSSRNNYGEGVVTDVMYGGLMIVECSSMEAVKELQNLLASMTWTEERSLPGVVKDVRKHLKAMCNAMHKTQLTAEKKLNETMSNKAGVAGAPSAIATKDWSTHRYRVIRRIGGRPMRDAVELEEISVFFDADEEMREERTTLHAPEQSLKMAPTASQASSSSAAAAVATAGASPSSGANGGRKNAPALPSLDLDKTTTTDPRPSSILHSTSPNGPDPDTTSSFSRVASAWFGLPIISAVLRAWGLHLLAYPEYAQPTALFLQKHAGLAPVLQLTALGSLYHDGNTPSDSDGAENALDELFFECDGPVYGDSRDSGGAAAAVHHPQPAPRIPKYNRFYASLPASPKDAQHDEASRQHSSSGSGFDSAKGGSRGSRKQGSPKSKRSSKDAPTAASSPSQTQASNAALDEMGHAPHNADNTGHGRLRVLDPTYHDDNDDSGLGPARHGKETVAGEGGTHLMDSQNSTNSPLTIGRQDTSVPMNSIDTGGSSGNIAEEHKAKGKAAASATSKRASVKASSTGRGSAPPKRVAATRPSSPLSSGQITMQHSRRNDDRRRAPSSQASLSTTTSSDSSFFEASLSENMRHSTLLYQPNNNNNNNSGGSIVGSGCVTEQPSPSSSRLDRKTAAAASRSTTVVSFSSTVSTPARPGAGRADAPRIVVPTSTDGVLNSASETPSKPGSPELFTPTPMVGNTALREESAFELVAMARTVGPAESLAAQEAQRKVSAIDASWQQKQQVSGAQSSPHERRGSFRSLTATAATTTSPPDPTATASEGSARRKGKSKVLKKTTKKATKKEKKIASAEASSSSPSPRAAASSPPPPLQPVAPSTVGACDAKKAQNCLLGTSTGVSGRTHGPDTPSNTHPSAVHSLTLGVNATAAPASSGGDGGNGGSATASSVAARHIREEEAEGLWYMTMLEVKARRQELEDLREARRNAEDLRQKRQDELRALNRVFLPHTHPQELDCALLYLKTVLFEPDDIPHARLFLQTLDWLPLLSAVWTSPANRIRSVEVAAELTWMDIPRLGVMTGLLYHHNASSPLEELIIRSDKLLGAPRYFPTPKGGEDATSTSTGSGSGGGGFLSKMKRQKAKKEKLNDSMNVSNTSLNFVTELDRTGSGFGPGCPPFFIAPEEARDTLWLLLCAVATNTATTNFRVVLKGIPTPATGGVGGSSGGGGGGSAEHERATSSVLASIFASRRREEKGSEPLLLDPQSMLLNSFVVQPTLHDDGNDDNPTSQQNRSLFKPTALPPVVSVSAGGGSPDRVFRAPQNSTFDEAGYVATASGSIRFDSPGPQGTAASSPDGQHSPGTSRQPSSLIIVTSSLGNVTSQDPLGGEDATSSSFTPGQHAKLSASSVMTVRPIHSTSPGRGNPLPPLTQQATEKVTTHQHHVKRRPWVRDGVEVEARPFYEVLMHRCGPIEEARIAAANSGDASLLASPYVPHYHHPYNDAHNDARFYVPVDRQERLQKAVRRAVAVANGEAPPLDTDDGSVVYSSKAILPSAKLQQQSESQQQSGECTRTPSPPRVTVLCPPPLLFCESNMVFGLTSAEEEAKVLFYEERQLHHRAADIWEALRKSVKHYNQAQQEARHKAGKAAAKNSSSSSSPLPPLRLITLES